MKIKLKLNYGDKIGSCVYLNDEGIHCSSGRRTAKFKCVCGNEFIGVISEIKSGNTKSCGCRKIKAIKDMSTTHGHTVNGITTSEYYTYNNMISRCYNEKDLHYKNYGGRGISVCERWKESFSNFINDMGKKPSRDHSIDRIDFNGDYAH